MPPKHKKLSGRAASKFEQRLDDDGKTESRIKKGMKVQARAAAAGKFSAADLVAKAEQFMDRMEPELALKFYERLI
jgi:hypothetical protein